MAEQLGSQPLIGAEAIQRKCSADQLLIGCWNSGQPAVQIGQQLSAIIQNADAPGCCGPTDSGANGALELWAERALHTTRQSLALDRGRWLQQLDSLSRRAEDSQNQKAGVRQTPHGKPHGRSSPLTTPETR
ncbi:MAG: Uncharacterised protein [Synechococcus sp. CC9902]|nr:MAG: Uncharacterised protein [Synechococcus sp. CC9902]